MRALTTSRGIARDPAIATLLEREVKVGLSAREGDVVIGWGQKDNTGKARDYAASKRLPYWRLEDGFIGYLSHPAVDRRRLSMVVDKSGIYYDAHGSSDLEKRLNEDDWITEADIMRATSAIERIKKWRISKYNHVSFDLPPEVSTKLSSFKGPKVLVVDQTYGDKSITQGMASAELFDDMLYDALEENPTALVVVKIHPDVLLGTKRGHYDPTNNHLADNDRILFVAEECNPFALMEMVDHVYVVTSQMGLEALLAGRKVTCYGVPFYAGWGLTHDKQLVENRAANRTLPELFSAVYLHYTRYIDPYSGQRVELERILDFLISEKQKPKVEAKRIVAVGFSLWKRGFVAEFVGAAAKLHFIKAKALAGFTFEKGDALLLWGRKHDAAVAELNVNCPIWRMEDGFLRSVGLGSDLRRPSSLVIDNVGIYYDATCASSLEQFLNTHKFSPEDLSRGANLRESILEARVSKYNVGERAALDFKSKAGGKEVILVPGQVEGDASLQYGSPDAQTNAALLEAVRADHPEAYIVFKPHPDVVSGNREGEVPADVLARCANDTVISADIIDCIDAVDMVCTMTSLSGFEALLRGVAVKTYGSPFYAGWGLTSDKVTVARRTRTLPLDGLVYALLCVYARYVDWQTGHSTCPEAIVEQMKNSGNAQVSSGPFAPISRWTRKAVYLLDALRR